MQLLEKYKFKTVNNFEDSKHLILESKMFEQF
jgi:hypothetical protein